ncbi:MAG: ABC transporter permease [Candidatus Aminicenantaceae bacterium]
MAVKAKNSFANFLASTGEIFSFFFFLGKRVKRTKIFLVISFLPVVIALIIKFIQFFNQNISIRGITIFSNIIIFFYLQFLILILALFFGTSICSEEIEAKTLTYLTTRPVPKSAIVLGKYAAYTLLIILMVNIGVVFSFIVLNLDHLFDFSLYRILFRDMGVLTLGLVCYTAFFNLIGTFLKKSILFGLIFSFGWENVIQYFPGSTQRFTIVHYLKSLLPQPGSRFSFLLFRLEPSPHVKAVIFLFLMTGIFLVLACLVFSQKEYILED